MPKQQITSAKIRQPSGHFSHATMVAARGRIVFISGMTARRADGTISGIGAVEAQTRQGWENLKAAVGGGGGKMDDICRVDVYVRNMEHFDQIHKVRREYFKPPAPASTMVEVCKMTSPEYLIEINARSENTPTRSGHCARFGRRAGESSEVDRAVGRAAGGSPPRHRPRPL